jgi:hypothetical protein
MAIKQKLNELFESSDQNFRQQGAELLRSLQPEERKNFLADAQLLDTGKPSGDLPWCLELINVFLENHPRRNEICGLDLSDSILSDVGDLSFPSLPNLRFLNIGKLAANYGNASVWPEKLSFLKCHHWNLEYRGDNNPSNIFQLLSSHPQVALHWYQDFEIILWVSTWRGYDEVKLYIILDPKYSDSGVESFTYYFTTDQGQLDWGIVLFNDGEITIYDRGFDCPTEEHPLSLVRKFDGDEWYDDSCLVFVDKDHKIHHIESFDECDPEKDLPQGFQSYHWPNLMVFPTEEGMPDYPFFPEFLNLAVPVFDDESNYLCTPRSDYQFGTKRTPQFWLGAFGKYIPGLSIGFPLMDNAEECRSDNHVKTQWKFPVFLDNQFNQFIFTAGLAEVIVKSIYGSEIWLESRAYGANMSEKATEANNLYEQLGSDGDAGDEQLFTPYLDQLHKALKEYIDKIGMVHIETFFNFEKNRIAVVAGGVASLFEYDNTIRSVSCWSNKNYSCSYLAWDVLDCEHKLIKDYSYYDEHNLNLSKDKQERFFSSSLERYLKIHPKLEETIKNP